MELRYSADEAATAARDSAAEAQTAYAPSCTAPARALSPSFCVSRHNVHIRSAERTVLPQRPPNLWRLHFVLSLLFFIELSVLNVRVSRFARVESFAAQPNLFLALRTAETVRAD